jgi:hypothetical protein
MTPTPKFILEFGIGEVLCRCLLGDLALVGVVPIRPEAGDDLLLPASVEGDGLQDHRLAIHLGDVVLPYFQPSHVVVDLGEEADAVLQIDGTHALEASPEGHPLGRRLGRDLVREEDPWCCNHRYFVLLRPLHVKTNDHARYGTIGRPLFQVIRGDRLRIDRLAKPCASAPPSRCSIISLDM